MVKTLDQLIDTHFDKLDVAVKKAFDAQPNDKVNLNPELQIAILRRVKADFDKRTRNSNKPKKHIIESAMRWITPNGDYLTFIMTTEGEDPILGNEEYFNDRYGVLQVPEFTVRRYEGGAERYEVKGQHDEFFFPFSAEQWDEIKKHTKPNIKLYIKGTDGLAYGPYDENSWLYGSGSALEARGKQQKVYTESEERILKGSVMEARSAPSAEPMKLDEVKKGKKKDD